MNERSDVYAELRKALDEAEARGDAVIGTLTFFGGSGENRNSVLPVIIDKEMTGADLFDAFVDSSYQHGGLARLVSQALDVPPVILALQVSDAINKASKEDLPEESDLFGASPAGMA